MAAGSRLLITSTTIDTRPAKVADYKRRAERIPRF